MTKSISPAETNLQSKEKIPFFKFVLTGGPCAGKTTALARIYSYLRERGFEVITCPECFTILASNGLSLDFFGVDGMDKIIQNSVMDIQISMEEGLEKTLRGFGKPAVLLCDRGPMDGAAYLSEEKWNSILKERGVTVTDLRDRRYNAVLHMVTAADGAEAFYTLENNAVRSEDAATAMTLDRKTQKAWSGHAHHYVFDNATDFEGKLQRIVDTISKLVGLPSNLSRRSAKFLLKSVPDPKSFPEDVVYHSFEVEKVYLVNQDADKESYSFIRKRTTIDRDGKLMGTVYQITTVQQTADGETIEQKRIINAREYNTAYKSRDSSRHIIVQKRISFLYKLQSFTIHQYEKPSKGLCFLHAQVETGTDSAREAKCKVEIPQFLDVDRRLKGAEDERKYGAYGLSLITE
ncbi:unnamed protein product [Cylindrotheca closterium]|uniref:NadR/Ttd14 AAA domain-containing protein n=1 Tax=Cylindrotheca closterium TaxID=2856 RepID=A0AAD2D1F3_9STRA|nr:unnamed protein product [Cylindrotheca closterium]